MFIDSEIKEGLGEKPHYAARETCKSSHLWNLEIRGGVYESYQWFKVAYVFLCFPDAQAEW